ncbi:MAG TPA: phenylalanine--tRNA ligase subunit beta [Caldilineaceae bacterium]|nr:phenylalanine--tRNA ligase subunit beta [Caldilineaceae bacterium]
MQVPLSWLKEYVDIVLPVEALAERLTLAGMEVAGVQAIGAWWDPETIRVGQVVAVLPHPNADRLVLVDVDYGAAEPQRVVTGAPNLFVYRGMRLADGSLPTLKVAFARAGATLVDAYSEARPFKPLKPTKIRGVESAGMVCSERELGLSEEHEGILLLPEDAPVGMPLRDYLGDTVLEVELTTDMARCLSIIGMAREVAALTGAPLHLPADEWSPSGNDQAGDYAAVEIEEPALCNRYTATLILDVTVGESPKWMQERLRKAGMRPINNIVDITNYVMLEWGQPLHAFDYDILKARAQRVGETKPTIIVRRAAAGEKFTTLDDVERELDDSMLMIADRAGSIAIAGVMGGQESEVSAATRHVLLESATFEGINNRRTSQKLRLPSEASYRFARGVPSRLNDLAARRAAELMRLYAGGRIVPGQVDVYPVPQEQPVVYTTESDMRRLLGMPVELFEVAAALRRLDIGVRRVENVSPAAPPSATFALARQEHEPLLECTPPWYRLDIQIPADLTEEVARIIGYEQVGTTLMDEELPTQRTNAVLETEEQVRDILVRAGLQETISRTLTTPEEHYKLRGIAGNRQAPFIELANPSAPERRVMRRSMLVGALENLARNLRYTDRLAIFEVGRVYLPEEGDGVLPKEERRVSILLCGPRRPASFYNPDGDDEPMDFFDLKGVVETLLDRLGFKPAGIEFRARPDTETFGPRCAELVVEGRPAGILGELHPQVRAAYGLPAVRVCLADLWVDALVKPHWRVDPMPPISPYPPVVEDLAFEVAEEVTARAIEDAIRAAADERLVAVEIFDVYRGEPLAPGHKSLAYRLTYQSTERSLSEQEVAALRRRIVAGVEKATGGKLRS